MPHEQEELSFDGNDGLQLWRESVVPKRTETQGELEANEDESGYVRWKEKQNERRRHFEQRYGVSLEQPVRVSLNFMNQEIEGKIAMNTDSAGQVVLRIGTLTFSPENIEQIVRIN